jgi:single-strand DNA-binding protein
MNQVILTGRLTKDPTIEHTKNGNSISQFVIATNRPVVRDGKKETDFITCIAWSKLAENLVKYQRKGNLIAVSGELRIDSYETNGEKKYKTYVLANGVEFLEAKKDMADDEYEDFQKISAKTKREEPIEIEDSDLPF